MRLHEKYREIEMHVQKIVTPEWLKRHFMFNLFGAGCPKSECHQTEVGGVQVEVGSCSG